MPKASKKKSNRYCKDCGGKQRQELETYSKNRCDKCGKLTWVTFAGNFIYDD